MSKWRKKPVVIDAFKWTGGPDQTEDPEWIIEAMKAGTVRFNMLGELMEIDTLEGTHRAQFGDFIIQGVKGEIYPCKPDIFEMTYEKVDDKPAIKTNIWGQPIITNLDFTKNAGRRDGM